MATTSRREKLRQLKERSAKTMKAQVSAESDMQIPDIPSEAPVETKVAETENNAITSEKTNHSSLDNKASQAEQTPKSTPITQNAVAQKGGASQTVLKDRKAEAADEDSTHHPVKIIEYNTPQPVTINEDKVRQAATTSENSASILDYTYRVTEKESKTVSFMISAVG